MKKKILITMVVAILAISTLALVACGGNTDKDAKMEVKIQDSQIKALMDVKALNADAAIIDATMAGYILKSDGSFADLKVVEVSDANFVKEYYGVAAKKGNTKLIDFINYGIYKMQNDATADKKSTYDQLLEKYGLESRANKLNKVYTEPTDWKSSLKDNKVIIGYTNNAPMGIEKDGEVTGFDIDLAKKIFEGTGVTVETQLIKWSQKETLLTTGTIDLVWNGLTITPERIENMAISAEYLINAQAIVVNSKNTEVSISKIADMKGLKIVVEGGSAGEENAMRFKDIVNK